MKTPILGSAYVARSVNAAANRLVNLFPESIPEGGKEAAFFSRCPGLRLLCTAGTGPIRGLWQFGGFGYAVSGVELYKVSSSWATTLLGTVDGTGPVSMSDNGTQLFVACNPSGYIYNAQTDTFQKITDPDFPGAVTVCYLDGYFLFNEPNSQKIWITSLLDGTAIDPLEFASAEGSPDGLVSVMVDHREAWLFGANSIEVWYDSGATDFPLARIQGAFNEIGCAAAYSVAKLDNGLFWLGSDARGSGMVYRTQGYSGVRISTHAIEFAIQGYSRVDDAIAYTYQQEGHSFYVLTFPTANATWVYDVSVGAWHERAGFNDGSFTRHRSNCQMNFGGEIVVGDYQNGRLSAFDLDIYVDNSSTQKWLRSWRALPTGQNNLKRTVQHSLQLDCEAGVGLNYFAENVVNITAVQTGITQAVVGTEPGQTIFNESFSGRKLGDITDDGSVGISDVIEIGKYIAGTSTYSAYIDGTMTTIILSDPVKYANYITFDTRSDPQVLLRWSDDGGHTWSNYQSRGIGSIGQTGQRVIWRRLGMTAKLRDRVYEVSGTDPVKIAIMGAELLIDPSSS